MAGFDSAAAAATVQYWSPWHSPIPYLFGGLAATLGVIAFALLILACSYWKLSCPEDGERDLEVDGGDRDAKAAPPVVEQKFLVIMAEQQNPTFLATPMSKYSAFEEKDIEMANMLK